MASRSRWPAPIGDEGDDLVDGGAGRDIAQFSGASRTGYGLRVEDGKLVMRDLHRSDGTDTVVDVEVLRFASAYRTFARDHGIAHQPINPRAGERARASSGGAIHVQNVNAYHRRLKEWLARFHGVASWRLPNCLDCH